MFLQIGLNSDGYTIYFLQREGHTKSLADFFFIVHTQMSFSARYRGGDYYNTAHQTRIQVKELDQGEK